MRIFNFQFSILKHKQNNSGFSLIETLVVVGLFAVIGIVVAQSTAVSLQGSRKADASSKVRENLNQAINVMERQLRSAKAITSPVCSTGGTSSTSINYTDQRGNPGSFTCYPEPNCTSNSYVASPSAGTPLNLTSVETLCITACQFTCTKPVSGPPTIDILLEGKSKEATGVEDTTIIVKTSVNLRAY